MADLIQLRRDTKENWETNNPVLQLAEPGLETDTRKVKYGDGVTSWNDLPYASNLTPQQEIDLEESLKRVVKWTGTFDIGENFTFAIPNHTFTELREILDAGNFIHISFIYQDTGVWDFVSKCGLFGYFFVTIDTTFHEYHDDVGIYILAANAGDNDSIELSLHLYDSNNYYKKDEVDEEISDAVTPLENNKLGFFVVDSLPSPWSAETNKLYLINDADNRFYRGYFTNGTNWIPLGYLKPVDGIPGSDLAESVQASLNKADAAALQADTYTKTETDALLNLKQGTLTFDTTPTVGSTNPVTSGGVKVELDTKADADAVAYVGNVVAAETDVDFTEIDAVPTAGSNNAVSSGGVWNAMSTTIKWLDEKSLPYEYGFVRPAGTESSSTSYYKSDYIYIPEGATILNIHSKVSTVSVSPVVFYKADKSYKSGITATSEQATVISDYEVPIPSDARYARFSFQGNTLSDFSVLITAPLKSLHQLANVYISPNGADSNDGSDSSKPVQSMLRARDLLALNGTLNIMPGVYEQYPNLGLFPNIVGIDNPTIMPYNMKITSATLASGYTRVYSVTYTGRDALSNFDILYQHDIPESGTEISDAERHPLHRGRTYRMPSTRIYPASSIQEIEETTDRLMWYYSGTTLYFSKVAASDLAANPIIVPKMSDFGQWGGMNINWCGFSVKYVPVSIARSSGVLERVSIGPVSKSGYALQCDYCNIVLRECEFYAAHISGGGDGVNTHNQDTSVCAHSNVTLENCWLHDNGDDGESCHENSTSVHIGGLVEYNGNGITPASGGGSQCYDVLVRKNGGHAWVTDNLGTGFSSQGGIMRCLGCISQNNNYGYYASSNSYLSVVNCISQNDTVAKSGLNEDINNTIVQ